MPCHSTNARKRFCQQTLTLNFLTSLTLLVALPFLPIIKLLNFFFYTKNFFFYWKSYFIEFSVLKDNGNNENQVIN